MRRALFMLIMLALSACFMLAQNKPSPLAWIEKGFMANPWGTKINELVDGTSLITDPNQRKNSQKLTCKFANQQGSEKVYECPVTVTFEGLDIENVKYLTKWDELTGVDFVAKDTKNVLETFARDLGAASSPEEDVYVWKKGDVTIQVVDIGGDAGITVTYDPPYINPDPKAAVDKLMSGIFEHAWGEDKEVMEKKGLLGKKTEGGICEDCKIYDSKEMGKSFGGVPMIMEYSGYYYNKDSKLTGALLMFDQKHYNSIVDAVNTNLGVSPYNNHTYGKIWNQKGIYVDVGKDGTFKIIQKQLAGLDETWGTIRKQD